jgi:hypothetical protein
LIAFLGNGDTKRVILVDDGIYVEVDGYRNHFSSSSNALLAPYESTLSKRKSQLPAMINPNRRELTSRIEWRNTIRHDAKNAATKRIAQVGRRPRVGTQHTVFK